MSMQLMENLDDLRVGLYVKLNCSWWAHPFTTSRFKISSSKDIEAIRKIRKLKLYYDPALSDPLPKETDEPPPPDENTSGIIENAEPEPETQADIEEQEFPELQEFESPIDEPTEASPNEPAVLITIPDPEELKKDRKRLYQERRTHLKRVEDAYWKVLGRSKDIFRRVSSGQGEGIKNAAQLVSNVTDVLNHDGATMTLMDVVSSTGMTEGLSSHALNVCILSTVVGRELGLTGDELLELGMGALFHDMGKKLLPMKVNFRTSGITMEADPESMKDHPEKGKELMEQYPSFPPESIKIIHQHHERMDGSGYPSGLTGHHISRLAQIVMVTDEYDEFCNSANPEKSMTPHEALSHLYKYTKIKGGKFPEDVILALIRTLTVYPPGTLVELTDGSFGIVTSINFQMPTKPLVLISHFEGTRQEALVVDLAYEESITIKRTLRPMEMPHKILEFLSPRRTAVFLHPDTATRQNPHS